MSVLGATSLTFLDIRFNSFSGPIPRELFNLDLDVLFLNNNQFTQQLPGNIGSTPALYLTFANNHFTGPIPSSIGRAKNLLEVLFLNNNLTGCLPYEIGFLNESTVFDVSCNKLTGPIPHSFACLTKIEILNLATNEFYGPVPEMVCKLPNLQNLSLSGNYFTLVGPECRKLILLKRLDVGKNCILNLPNQRTAEQCREFFSKHRKCPNEKSLSIIPCSKNYRSTAAKFDQQSTVSAPPPKSYDALSPQNNKAITCDPNGVTRSWNRADRNVCRFDGFTCAERPDTRVLSVAAANFNGYNFGGPNFQVKDLLDQLVDLSIFHANSNNFAGNLPNERELQNIKFLFELDLSNNKYTGGFPMSVIGGTSLTFLDISGPIPSSIGSAKNLQEVLFLNNNFTGCLPYEIGFLNNSTLFDVSCNKLTGPIPHSFACLAKIQILNLATNEFYGPVPEMVCKLPYLQNLSLSGNYFTQVGPECRKLIQLQRLDVSNNCILDLPNQKSAQMCREFFSMHKQCPNEKSLNIVPCLQDYRKASTMFDQKSTFAATPPRSYDALSPQNNFRF
ncbi:hypothetical protein GH714_014543 [Hevea brasiliensis]|uniref:Leucine-rich repeat-containing N-terminal plant-type domain-containing protein n=1 Tax=Hevea brasiliensis TaxID=3981 RepID=A0A6A6L4S4_HEVBR|nr:hypothetical protein GH714_014543 [Hevea brasiliensis]